MPYLVVARAKATSRTKNRDQGSGCRRCTVRKVVRLKTWPENVLTTNLLNLRGRIAGTSRHRHLEGREKKVWRQGREREVAKGCWKIATNGRLRKRSRVGWKKEEDRETGEGWNLGLKSLLRGVIENMIASNLKEG